MNLKLWIGLLSEWLFLPRRISLKWETPHHRVGETRQGISIRSLKGEEIVSRIVARAAFMDNTGKVIKSRLKLTSSEYFPDSCTYQATWSNGWYAMHLSLQDDPLGGEIKAAAETMVIGTPPAQLIHADNKTRIVHSLFRIDFPLLLSLRELYLKNRTVVTRGGLLPVWLDRQGVSLGKRGQVFHLYHVPHISSIRYRRWPHRLTLYTDHAHDHRFATASATENNPVYDDISHTPMGVGDTIKSTFSFLAGTAPEVQPLIWLHPEGHDATLIWTSHPDNSTLASTTAITMGRSDMDPNDKPVGGFCAHQVPMTMAAFYHTDHPNHISLTNHPDGEAYLRLTRRLAEEFGFEVIPHAASSHHASDKLTEEAIAFFSKQFSNVNWTDHSAHIQRSTLSGDGAVAEAWLPGLLSDHGIRYAWHYGSELKYFTGHTVRDDARGLDLLKTGAPFNGGEHTPLWWHHPARLGELVTWKSSPLGRLRHFPMTGLQWLVWFKQHLPALMRNHGVAVVHDYPAWVYRKKNLDGNGVYLRKESQQGDLFEVDPLFNRLLADLNALQGTGKLHCTTVKAFLDYQLAMEKVRFHYPEKNRVVIINTSTRETKVVLALPEGCRLQTMPENMSFLRRTKTMKLYSIQLDAGEDAGIRFV